MIIMNQILIKQVISLYLIFPDKTDYEVSKGDINLMASMTQSLCQNKISPTYCGVWCAPQPARSSHWFSCK